MNSCLADLSRLIPPQYQRKSRGRIEKTEIIEMAIKHIKNIQAKANAAEGNNGGASAESSSVAAAAARQCFPVDPYREGYQECLATAVQFLIDLSAHFEDICLKMVNHLKDHFNDVVKGDHCSTNYNASSSSGGNFNPNKRRHQDNGSPTTTGPLNGLGQFLLANGGAMEGRQGNGGGGAGASLGNGIGPRLAHLCGSINGHSSSSSSGSPGSASGGSGGMKNGGGGGCGGPCEGLPSSSDGPEVICAKDLSCRGANSNNKNNISNNNSSAQAATTSTNHHNDNNCNGGQEGGNNTAAGGGGGCRKNPQQTPVITSTASTSVCSTQTADLLVHAETESSSSALDHSCVMDGTAAGSSGGSGAVVKVHNLTDTSCDGVEHHYKYKHYMQQRFSHERYHDEHVVSNSSNELHDHHDHSMMMIQEGGERGERAERAGGGRSTVASEVVEALLASAGGGVSGRGMMAPPPVEPTDSNCSVDTFVAFSAKRAAMATLEALKNSGRDREDLAGASSLLQNHNSAAAAAVIKEEKMDTSPIGTCEVAPRMVEGSQQMPRLKTKARITTIPVPIFALHSHGAFYIPLTVDYEALVPFLGEVNLLDKSLAAVKALHPVNINIYAPF